MHTVQEHEPLAPEVYTTYILHCSQEANYQIITLNERTKRDVR